MINYKYQKGSTNVSVVLRAVDDSDGTPEPAFDHATTGIDLKYRREGAANVDITEAALAALTTAHTDGGVEQIGNGYFRLDLPDAALASGADGVAVHGTATGMVIIGCYIQLVDYDPFDATRLGLTALPNANADAAGGLAVSDAGGLDLDGLDTHLTDIKGATFSGGTDSLEAIRDRGDSAWTTGGGAGLAQSINPVLAIPPIIDLSNTATVRIGVILTNSVDDLPTTAEITPGTITIARKAQGGTSWVNVVSAAAMSEQDGFVYFDEVFDSGSGYAEGDTIRVQFEGISVTADANTFNITGATGVFLYSYIVDNSATITGTFDANVIQWNSVALSTTNPLPNAAAGAAAGLPTRDNVNTEVDTALSDIHLDHLFATAYDATAKPGAADALLNEMVEDDAGLTRYTVNALEQGPSGSGASASAIADAVWDELQADHVAVGSMGELGSEIASILADTNELQGDWVNGGRLDLILDATASQSSVDTIDGIVDSILVDTGTTLETHLTDIKGATFAGATDSLEAIRNQGDAAWITGAGSSLTAADVRIEMDANSVALADIEADTIDIQGRLPAALVGGKMDSDVSAIQSATANEIADALLNRDMSAVSDTTARSPLNALRFLRNQWSISGTTLTVTKEDDSTSAWTATLTTNASADPVTGSDPA